MLYYSSKFAVIILMHILRNHLDIPAVVQDEALQEGRLIYKLGRDELRNTIDSAVNSGMRR